jgi:two-component system, chemotaxis family, sensor kinase CheA
MDELISDFAADTRDGYDRILPDIARWSHDHTDRAALDAIFRFVHTVRGNASFIKIERIERLCAPTEHILSAFRDGRRVADPDGVSAVLAIVDRVGAVAAAIEDGTNISAADEPALIAALAIDIDYVEPSPMPQRRTQRAQTVRFSVAQFESMMSAVEALDAAHRSLLDVIAQSAEPSILSPAVSDLTTAIGATTLAFQNARRQPLSDLVIGLDRLVAQTALALGKDVRLRVHGADMLVDRAHMAVLRDVLVHLIRNAIDHGIETPDARIGAGKDAFGTVTLQAERSASHLIIRVFDDGRGIHQSIVSRGQSLVDHLSTPGFSTAVNSPVSGHGVGLDVVKTSVEDIGGDVQIGQQPGAGLCITLTIPDTMIIADAA